MIAQRNDIQQWKDNSVSYGQRWIAKTVFSSFHEENVWRVCLLDKDGKHETRITA